jgi:lipopolysaccharide export LptBFGC system permease protein LptF
MKKKNYLIPILSIAFIGTAAFFIFKSLKIKKEKQRLKEKDKDVDKNVNQNVDTNTDTTNQGVFYDVLKNIFVKKDNPVSEQPINDADKKKLAAQVLFSKNGTRLRENPNSTSKILETLPKKGIKLTRVFSPNIQTMLILPNAPVKEGNYTWVLVISETAKKVRGWVRLDVVDL